MGKHPWYFMVVNDWLYWFKDEVSGNVGANAAALAGALGAHAGHINVGRCNIVAKSDCDLEIIQPAGPNLLLSSETARDSEQWLFALTEISVAGYPLPTFLNLPSKSDWVTFNGGPDRVHLRLSDWTLVLSRDEKGDAVIRRVGLEGATVAKGKTASGSAGFILADTSEKIVFGTHNPGVAQEWVDAIKYTINLSWCRAYEPDKLPKAVSRPTVNSI